jgi:SH3 domain-containing YSC84-like protein 1
MLAAASGPWAARFGSRGYRLRHPTSMKVTIVAALLLYTLGCSHPPKSPSEARDALGHAAEELSDATQVLDEMNQIPARHRERARCVMVIPSLLRAGLIVGARHGDGVVSCRVQGGWSAPAFVTMTGGSAGFQAGVESSDMVMLVTSDRAMTTLFRSSFTLGTDASASAGPVGEAAQAGTDASMRAEILSYAHSRGLFAGAELSGAVVKQDSDALAATYGPSADVHGILGGAIAPPPMSRAFLERLTASFPVAPIATPAAP